jgi:hypothetical protein
MIMASVMNHYKINSLEQSKLMAADLLFCKGSRACNGPITIRSHLLLKGVGYEAITEQLTTGYRRATQKPDAKALLRAAASCKL